MLNWLVRFPLNIFMPYGQAVFAATTLGMIFGFLLYRTWVFKSIQRRASMQVRDFILVNLLGIIVTVVTAIVLRELLIGLTIKETVADASAHMTGIAAGACVNYLGHRHITFPKE